MNVALPIPMSPPYTHSLLNTVTTPTLQDNRTGQEHRSSMSCGAIRDRLEIKQWVEEWMVVV